MRARAHFCSEFFFSLFLFLSFFPFTFEFQQLEFYRRAICIQLELRLTSVQMQEFLFIHVTDQACYYFNINRAIVTRYKRAPVWGNFTIDCDVTIAPGAQIFVDNGYTLTLNTNSNIHACSKMWKGIQVASGGSLVMNGNATIADAEYGVIALEGCTLNINGGAGNCVFDKCYIGIQMPSYSTQKSYSIAKTKFNSSGALAPPYSGQTTFLGTKTNTGISALAKSTIVLTNVEFNGIEKGVVLNDGIINVSGTSNTINSKFLNLNYAIIATGISTIISSDCDFTNIVDPSIVSPIQSVAVNNTGTGSSTLLRNHFTNCDLAIRSTSGTAYYKENTFSNLNTAIEVITPTNKAVFIQANNIECRLGGINLSLMQDAATVEINGNFVEVGDLVSPTSASSYGVQYTATQANSNNYRHVIRYNNITLKSQGMAISSSFKSNLRIMSNIIELQKVGNLILDQVGIVCDHNGGGIVTCNDVTGDDNGAASQQNNMRIISCYNSNIMCNSVHGGGDGMRFTGNNGWVNLRTNYFDNDYRGLFLDNMTTSIGPQTHSGNFWSTTYSTSLNHFAAQNFSFNLGEEFKIDMTNSDPIYWPSAISPLSWFVTDINGGKEKGCIIEGKRGGITYQSPICGLHSSPFTQFREGHEITYSDTLIVSDTLPASLYAEEISTEAKMMLYERLSETRDVWDTIILFSMFYDSLENTNIGAFNEIEHVEQDKDSADKVLENNILFTDSLILWYTSIIAYNDSIGGDSLAAENVSHYATIESLLGAKDVYENLIENGRYSRTLLARQLNDDIDINNLSDQNRVLVNSIEYECIERGDYNYDKQEELVLSSIAHQCPQAGGDAVIAARALYGLRFPNEYYDDRNACLAEGFFRKSNPKNDLQKASPLSYFAISPNPTSDILTLNYYIADNTEIEFSMFNALQQKVKSEKLTAESKQYLTNCNDLSNGIYIYTLKSGDEIIFRGKISVIDQRQ
jgi:hypothetical protein